MFDQTFRATEARGASKEFETSRDVERFAASAPHLNGRHSAGARHLTPDDLVRRVARESRIMHRLDALV